MILQKGLVLITKDDSTSSDGGILLPQGAVAVELVSGTVIQVGDPRNEFDCLELKTGDRVVFREMLGFPIKVDGQPRILASTKDIVLRLNGETISCDSI